MSRKSLKKSKIGISDIKHFRNKNPFNVLNELDDITDRPWLQIEDGIKTFKPTDMLIIDRAPDVVDDISISKPARVSLSKTQKRKRAKQNRKEIIEKAKNKWLKIKPSIIDDPVHVIPFKKAIAEFFRPGYKRYIAHAQEDFKDNDINEYVSSVLKKYKAVITGGFVLKNMGLFAEGNAKPSIDMDIFHSFQSPLRGDFYNDMAKLFNCDIESQVGDKITWNHKYMPGTYRDGRLSILGKQRMDSVRKYVRNSDHETLYAEMDLCRAMNGTSYETIIRNFDMTICMNWYDGENIYSLDKESIIDPKNNTGWVHHKYAHCFDGYVNEESKKWCKRSYTRVLKYLLRGYRLSYVDPKTALVHELVTSQFPNEIRELNKIIREKYYKKNPDERPANIPEPLPELDAIFQLEEENKQEHRDKNIYMIGGHGGDYYPVPPDKVVLDEDGVPEGFFIVPDGCTVVAKANKGQYTFMIDKDEPTGMTINGTNALTREMLENPVKHATDLMHLFGIIKIYKEKELCPNFKYVLLACSNNPAATTSCKVNNGNNMYGLSGIISYDLLNDSPIEAGHKGPMQDYTDISDKISIIFYNRNDAVKFYHAKHNLVSTIRHTAGYTDSMKEGLERIITTLCGLYSYSVLPDKYMILKHIELAKKQYINLLLKDNLPEYSDIIKTFKYYAFNKIEITQKELCKQHTGVYYNFVCRAIDILTSEAYSIFATDKFKNADYIPKYLHAINMNKIYTEYPDNGKLLIKNILKESIQQARFKNGKYIMPNASRRKFKKNNNTYAQSVIRRLKNRHEMGISNKIDQIDKQIKITEGMHHLQKTRINLNDSLNAKAKEDAKASQNESKKKTINKLHEYKNAIIRQMNHNEIKEYAEHPNFKKYSYMNKMNKITRKSPGKSPRKYQKLQDYLNSPNNTANKRKLLENNANAYTNNYLNKFIENYKSKLHAISHKKSSAKHKIKGIVDNMQEYSNILGRQSPKP